MDNNSFRQQESDTQQSGGFLINMRIFDEALHWLTSLFQLTEEEREDAGIYLDHPPGGG